MKLFKDWPKNVSKSSEYIRKETADFVGVTITWLHL